MSRDYVRMQRGKALGRTVRTYIYATCCARPFPASFMRKCSVAVQAETPSRNPGYAPGFAPIIQLGNTVRYRKSGLQGHMIYKRIASHRRMPRSRNTQHSVGACAYTRGFLATETRKTTLTVDDFVSLARHITPLLQSQLLARPIQRRMRIYLQAHIWPIGVPLTVIGACAYKPDFTVFK